MTLDPTDSLFNTPSRALAADELRRLLGDGELNAVQSRLLREFASPLTSVRRRAVEVSAELPDTSPFQLAWLQLLDDPEWMVRESAVIAVTVLTHRPDIKSRLLSLTLTDPKPHVREASAKVLGPHVDPETDFGTALRHRFERQRERAAVALGFAVTRGDEAVRLLLTAVNDGHRKVRAAVVTALGRLPKTDAVRAALLAKAAENEPRVRDAARRAMSNAP